MNTIAFAQFFESQLTAQGTNLGDLLGCQFRVAIPGAARQALRLLAGVVVVALRIAFGVSTNSRSVTPRSPFGMEVHTTSLSASASAFRHHVSHVILVRAEEKMAGITASPIIAAVTGEQSIPERTNCQLQCEPVSASGSNPIHRKMAVASCQRSLPLPTFLNVADPNLGPEPLSVCLSQSQRISQSLRPNGRALSAKSFSSRRFSWNQRVAPVSYTPCSKAICHIVSATPRIQVAGVNATGVVAAVAQAESFGYLAMLDHPGDAMREKITDRIPHLPMAANSGVSLPLPTLVRPAPIHLRPEPLDVSLAQLLHSAPLKVSSPYRQQIPSFREGFRA